MRKPFVLVTVEGGIARAESTGEVDVAVIDYDVTETGDPHEIEAMLEVARAIPDEYAALPHDDPAWIDKAGIIATIEDDLAKALP